MSAYVVSHRHINAILTFANRANARLCAGVMRYDASNVEDLQRMAEILYAENVRSVNYRYRQPASLPGIVDETERDIVFNFVRDAFSPVDILRLCECYDYQACETPDYEASAAARIVNAIRHEAIRALPGYSNAKWRI